MKDLKIEFFSTVPFLNDIEECRPKPLTKFIPDWWKNVPNESGGHFTIKECPSFPQMFRSAFVVPMWADLQIKNTDRGPIWKIPHPAFRIESHNNNQFLDFAPKDVKDNVSKIMKFICPWNVITPPGYSVFQMSSFYEFNKDFEIMQGIIDTDLHHEINQQVLLPANLDEISIKRGQPFAVYIPFKRDEFKIETRDATQNDLDKLTRNTLKIFSKFKRGYKLMHDDKNVRR